MTAYIIKSVNTGKTIEGHDELSKEWAESKVETHNKLYPNDKWVLVPEEL